MSTTQHPLTEAAAVEMWDASPCSEGYEFRGMLTVEQDATLYAMRAAFDAGREHERANPDDRPWGPLKKGDPLHVGDEVRRDYRGITSTAVFDRVDGRGDPWTADRGFIGSLDHGTWYVRRTDQELPTEDGAQIIPAHGAIEAVRNGVTYTAVRAAYDGLEGVWVGVWRGEDDHSTYEMPTEHITPGTWKVGNR